MGLWDKTGQTGEKTHQPAVMEASPDSDAWATGLRTETPRQSPRDTMQRPEKNTLGILTGLWSGGVVVDKSEQATSRYSTPKPTCMRRRMTVTRRQQGRGINVVLLLLGYN